MDEIRFEWDSIQAQLNLAKHGVSFEEATTIFYDDKALLLSDPEHSDLNEDRFLMLGMSYEFHLLLVCHCYREDDVIRIISARKATKNEGKYYGGQL